MGLAVSALAQQKTAIRKDTVKVDTIIKQPGKNAGLNADVKYNAEDSIRIDRKNGLVYLYGKARVIYTDFELDADYIRLDQKNNTVFAKGSFDTEANRYRGRPIFRQGGDQPITTDSLIFNVKSKKGKSFGVFSEVDEGVSVGSGVIELLPPPPELSKFQLLPDFVKKYNLFLYVGPNERTFAFFGRLLT